jgi:replicative DNA helicase
MRYSATEVFVNSLLNEGAFIYYLEEGFKPDLLEREEAKAIWHFFRNYHERGRQTGLPDLEILEVEFPKYKFESTDKEPHWILDKLKERYEFKESQKIIQSVAEMKPDEVFPYLKGKLWEADQVLDSERNVSGHDDIPEMWERYLDQWNNDQRFGYTTGFETIDKEMGGIRAGQLAVLGGRLGNGKTWFALKAFTEQMIQEANPLLITLEMSVQEIQDRLFALWSGISFNSIDKGELSPQEMNELQEALIAQEKTKLPFKIVQPPIGQRKVADFVALADKYKSGSMIVDQISWIEARKPNTEYYRDDLRLTDIAMELKAAAQRPGREIPVYVMHQLNRNQKRDQAIDEANFAGADGILQTADHGFGIRQTKEQREKKVITFEIAKSRNAPTGEIFTCDFEFREKTNMANAVKGDTVGEMSVDDAAMIVARAFDPDPERVGSLQTT